MSMLNKLILTILCAVLLVAIPAAFAQSFAGQLDPSFGIGGRVTTDFGGNPSELRAAVVQPDGRIIAVGLAQSESVSEFAVFRYNSDGSLDEDNGGGGDASGDFFPATGGAFAVALQPDGKIVVAGYIIGGDGRENAFALARYNPDFNPDPSFGPSGDGLLRLHVALIHFPTALAIQADGKIVIAGTIRFTGRNDDDFVLLRLNNDGSLDATFGEGGMVVTDFFGGFDSATGVAILADGKVLAAGVTNPANGMPGNEQLVIVRYQGDGSPDTTFGNGGRVLTETPWLNTACAGFVIQQDGKIVLSTNGPGPGGVLLFRYNPEGALDSTFGVGGRVDHDFPLFVEYCPRSIAVDTNGRIVLAVSHAADSISSDDFLITRLNSDGSLDSSFGISGHVVTDFFGGEDIPSAVLLPGDGTYLVAGTATRSDGKSNFALSRYNSVAGAETSPGSGVTVQPVDNRTETQPVTVEFTTVTTEGATHLKTATFGPTLPSGFSLGEPATYYDIITTASYTPPVTICITYDPAHFGDPASLRLLHFENDTWVDLTTSNDTSNHIICAQVSSLSPFVIAQIDPSRSITVDIKPGSFPNSFNPRSNGVIPVAILTTSACDATTVDPMSVRFGPNGAVEAHRRGHIEDADGDGDLDLVLHFRTQNTGIACGATSASLIGNTFSGRAITGSDSIKTVGCK